jgi:hypothetical protein
MKTKADQIGFNLPLLKGPTLASLRPDYSVLVVIGSLMALALLSGCASPQAGGSSDTYQYNTGTGYPAVGSGLWH